MPVFSIKTIPAWSTLLTVFFFHLIVILVPLFFAFNTEELFEFNKLMLTYILTIGIVVCWLIRMISEKKLLVSKTALDIPIGLFLLSQILATLFSLHPRTSMLGYYARFHGGLISTFAYTTLYYAATSLLTKKQLRSILKSALASAVVVSIYAILEHFGHSFSCFLVSNGLSFDANCWKQDVQHRVFASFGQPNWLAAYTVILFPISAAFYLLSKKKLTQLTYLSICFLLLVTLLYTKSRSGILGFAVMLLLFSGTAWYYFWQQTKSFFQLKNRLLSLLGVIFIIILVLGTQFTPSLSSVLKPATPPPVTETEAVNRLEVGGTESGEIRKIVWRGAIDVWKRYPLFGSGVETFGYSYYQDRPMEHNLVSEWDFLYNKAHNEFLNYLATTGALGLGAYLLLLAAPSYQAVRTVFNQSNKNKKSAVLLAGASIAGIAGLSVTNFFGFSTVMVTILLFLFFAIIVIFSRESESPKPRKIKNLSAISIFGIIFTLIFGYWLLVQTFSYWQADKLFVISKNAFGAGDIETSLRSLEKATQLTPNESLFYDELAYQYAQVAVQLDKMDQATQAAEIAQTSMVVSDTALKLNPHQLNNYKTRARTFITLSQINPDYLLVAKETLLLARSLAPTDAKLVFNLASLELNLGNTDEAQELLETTLSMKPNYESARVLLAQIEEEAGNYQKALDQYLYINEKIAPGKENVTAKITELEQKIADE